MDERLRFIARLLEGEKMAPLEPPERFPTGGAGGGRIGGASHGASEVQEGPEPEEDR